MERERAVSSIVCPTCGENYETKDAVRRLLINVAHCINLTCLTDLSDLPIDEVLGSFSERRRQREMTTY